MSLDTLLEAARFIELQEQLRQSCDASPEVSPPPPPHPPRPPSLPPQPDFRPPSVLHQQPPIVHLKQQQIQEEPQVRPSALHHQQQQQRVIHNSFDMINPLVIDEVSGEQKRKQPPMVFRSGTREVHNKLEKHRRAHLKECFDLLKKQLPAAADEKKTSNLSILHAALRHIQLLKRRERDLEHEMERLAREKISAQQRLAVLKKEIASQFDNVDFSKLLPEPPPVQQQAPSVKTESPEAHLRQQQETGGSGNERVPIPPLPRPNVQFVNGTKEQQPVQTTTLSVLPVGYPVNQGLVLQKVALVPKGITELSPLVSSPAVAHFITAPQQLNGKVVPLVNVNAQYVMKPVVVVSTASRTS